MIIYFFTICHSTSFSILITILCIFISIYLCILLFSLIGWTIALCNQADFFYQVQGKWTISSAVLVYEQNSCFNLIFFTLILGKFKLFFPNFNGVILSVISQFYRRKQDILDSENNLTEISGFFQFSIDILLSLIASWQLFGYNNMYFFFQIITVSI